MENKQITDKVNYILMKETFNKVSLCLEIGITRPTLNTRLENNNWKKGEISLINKIYNKVLNETS